ncbi:nipped-B-like protein pqn-85 isoform X1 [Amborella trichopoda]|nr:nipped-B-like protein pqn-85 isoform X1 [Amborella trichopoda]|eukprot:XP_020522912.1 nipped-B-like protein pqn-85 isoform X1 [Amborella trichopoda]
MEDGNASAQHHLLIQQQQQQQQQLLLLHQQQQQQHQQQAISRFPSNIDPHLRAPASLNRAQIQAQAQAQKPSGLRPNIQLELEMAHQDAWRVCHPDIKRPFSSLEDACERLLPYHVVADYEAEEEDKILESEPSGQTLTRAQQWEHNITNKIQEFVATFEKQVMAYNMICRKRAQGEFRTEERIMIEQALLQEEKRALLELRAEIESREKEAKMRMAMAQVEQARVAEVVGLPHVVGPFMVKGEERGGLQQPNGEGAGPSEAWEGPQKEEEEPSEDFLNDDHDQENGEGGNAVQGEWREVGELDLNTRLSAINLMDGDRECGN